MRAVASGDALSCFLSYKALRSTSKKELRTILQSLFVYSLFHFGSFWFSHNFLKPHPDFIASMYLPSIALPFIMMMYYGYRDTLFQKGKTKEE